MLILEFYNNYYIIIKLRNLIIGMLNINFETAEINFNINKIFKPFN
jgi:hypothetical protein